jgi:hypothetical protein
VWLSADAARYSAALHRSLVNGCFCKFTGLCQSSLNLFKVQTTAQAALRAAAINCEGGTFRVAWTGEITLATTLIIGNDATLSITAASTVVAVMHGANKMQLIQTERGKLRMEGIILNEVASVSLGAAIDARERSDVTLIDCVLTHVKAATHAGIYTAGELLVQGCTFSNNFAGGSTASIDISATDYFAM